MEIKEGYDDDYYFYPRLFVCRHWPKRWMMTSRHRGRLVFKTKEHGIGISSSSSFGISHNLEPVRLTSLNSLFQEFTLATVASSKLTSQWICPLDKHFQVLYTLQQQALIRNTLLCFAPAARITDCWNLWKECFIMGFWTSFQQPATEDHSQQNSFGPTSEGKQEIVKHTCW